MKQSHDERQDYETPPELVAELAEEFGPFDIDVAASEANKKAPRCWTAADNALEQDWTGLNCWMNPPYGRITAKFVRKAAQAKARTTSLLPARTDTKWFHDWVMPYAKEVRFVKGRIKFLLNGKPAMSLDKKSGKLRPAAGKFPSMVVVWDGRPVGNLEVPK